MSCACVYISARVFYVTVPKIVTLLITLHKVGNAVLPSVTSYLPEVTLNVTNIYKNYQYVNEGGNGSNAFIKDALFRYVVKLSVMLDSAMAAFCVLTWGGVLV